MARRSLTVLAAAAAATAALVATAPTASAATTCNTTSDPKFDVTVCVQTNSLYSNYPVPYSVGSICVAGICTTPVSGTLNVPIANVNAVVLSGTVCVHYRGINECANFSTYIYPISIG